MSDGDFGGQDVDPGASRSPGDGTEQQVPELVVDLLREFETRLDRLEKYLEQNSDDLEEVQRELQALSRQVEENRRKQLPPDEAGG